MYIKKMSYLCTQIAFVREKAPAVPRQTVPKTINKPVTLIIYETAYAIDRTIEQNTDIRP